MRRKLNRSFLLMLMVMLVATALTIFVGCGDDDDCDDCDPDTVTVTVHDTIEVEISMINFEDGSITVPDNITQGIEITLIAEATTDAGVGELTYYWFADMGEFHENMGDTVVWKAPDDAGTAHITVHATDGEYIAIGMAAVGVGMYAPTADVYYQGVAQCGCHSNTVEDWEGTGHAHAWASLMESDHWAPYCFPCHAVGIDDIEGNGGYDEAPIAALENVQCESCHGPMGGNHPPEATNALYEAENCGVCHEGSHHPYYTEWEESAHAHALENHGAESGNCQGCHEGLAGLYYLSGDLNEFYGSGAIEVDRPDTTLFPINCQTCHDSHRSDHPGQIRTMADIHLAAANGMNPIVTEGGTGKLCMHCHHARRSADTQLENGYSHFGPHASPQADMVAGYTGYTGVAPGDFNWAGSSHLNIENSCRTCHINMRDYDGTTAVVGHSFEPTVEACAPCHGAVASFDEIMALDDFDGDGTVEGLRLEVMGLMHELEHQLVEAGLDTTGGVGILGALGDPERSTYVMREAGFNLAFVEEDWSEGIHNPDYAVQLLQQSLIHLTGDTKNMAIIEGEGQAVKW